MYDDSVPELIAEKSFSDKFGARNMRRFVEREVEDRIANIIVDGSSPVFGIAVSVVNGEINVSSI